MYCLDARYFKIYMDLGASLVCLMNVHSLEGPHACGHDVDCWEIPQQC